MLRALPLHNHRPEVLADRLARAEPCPWTGEITEDQIKIVLGEHASGRNRGAVTLANYKELVQH
ncbi:hypothetical protein [Bradyrhizobium sp. sBnM-33]|uniref:hypothetical protein n=1 Tax=Bradyrhizobium sp. sBnM-33 TaxID=2831780 RepID=UPI001BD026E0|nr:hypothetical protein [Bradyrhizobium sp. sBnM-33]WOH50693.1 hypothetical protein RX328_42960 [Bradyrhizobium sp. sBnM-33]